ncbi:MAG: hypothetical protein JO242_04885 [Streptosporangiaceae bacterium]|nr:hypothetical protein [Streptosporangiaceae bacterium]
MNVFSLRTATWLGATVVVAGLLGTAGCSSSSSSSSSAHASASSSVGASNNALTVKQIVLATTLKHSYRPDGKGAARTESLTQPDDIVTLGGNLYVGFQNGVGSQGEASTSGNLDSTLAEFTPAGSVVKQWDVTGKIDGMGADSATGQVIATVNEDSNSSLYTVSGGTVTHYTYTPSSLPHLGGTDAIAVYNGKILISASAPGTSGKAPASAPAMFAVTLNAGAKTAAVAPFFADNATATGVNAPNAGKTVALALTDPDSNGVVPSSSPKFAGDFMLNSQGDQELIFSGASGQNLQVLKISNPVDDTAWATSASGSLYATDSTSDTVDTITGSFTPGTAYTAVTPCNASSAPSTCPAPGYPANSLGTINLKTGAVGKVTLNGLVVPKGLIFVP